MRIVFVFLCLIIIVSCSKAKSDKDFFNGKNFSQKRIIIDSIKIDTLDFEVVESSFDGFLKIDNNNINFIDSRFGWFFTFDKYGHLISKNLGQGAGPKEINTGFIDAYIKLSNGKHVFIGSGYDVHIHNEDFEREKILIMQWDLKNESYEINPQNLNPEMHRLYSPDYSNFNLQQISDNEIYFPILAQHRFFNKFNSHRYFEESRILAKLNLDSKKIESLEGRKSREYLRYSFLSNYDFFDYQHSLKSNKTFITYEVDSLIYVYDKSFNNIYSFGNSGKHIGNTDFFEYKGGLNNEKEFREAYTFEKSKTGFYKNLIYFEDEDILIRTYFIGNSRTQDGMQVYIKNELIADVRVPKAFKVIGKIGDYFYSDIVINEEDNYFKCYKFKLEDVK
ncbi:hypothetical protein [Tenacibaculum sp. 190524A05c]|uniref:hypothetical protein n=1 Tax=Tenacibaculum platacis TaxID=3137852 RepID=UPI0032B24561